MSYPVQGQVLLAHPYTYSIGRFVVTFASVYSSDKADLERSGLFGLFSLEANSKQAILGYPNTVLTVIRKQAILTQYLQLYAERLS